MKNKIYDEEVEYFFVSSKINGGRKMFFPSSFDLNKIKKMNDYGNIYAKEVFDSLSWFREKKYIKLYAYCMMPNHIHFLAKIIGDRKIKKMVKEFHKFTAHQIMKLAEDKEDYDLLNYFAANNYKNDRKHLIWESCVGRPLYSEKAIVKRLDYIHNNPVRKGWRLVTEIEDYPYSSACYYLREEEPLIPVDYLWEDEEGRG